MSNEDNYWATVYATTGRTRAWYRRRAVARAVVTVLIVAVVLTAGWLWLGIMAAAFGK